MARCVPSSASYVMAWSGTKWCLALPLMQAQGKKWSDAQVYGTRTVLEAIKVGGLQALIDGNVADSVRPWSHRQPQYLTVHRQHSVYTRYGFARCPPATSSERTTWVRAPAPPPQQACGVRREHALGAGVQAPLGARREPVL